jgi:pimeloyl-ACP methyl ester carboxylesterase
VRRNTEVESVNRLRHAHPGDLEAYLLERNPGGGELLANTLAREFRMAADAAFETILGAGPFEAQPVKVRTLVVQADPERGGLLGDGAATEALATLGNAKLVKIDGAAHAVHASHPAELASAIRAFANYSSADVSPTSTPSL